MLATVESYSLSGIDAYPVTIEVDASPGLPGITIVGLPDNAVKESRERVRAAIKNSGFEFPSMRITINLSPADIKKEGPCFDLPIALAYLAATEQIPRKALADIIVIGELSLDGSLKHVHGILPVSLSLPKNSFSHFIVPEDNAQEALIGHHSPVFPMKNLEETVHLLCNDRNRPPAQRVPDDTPHSLCEYSLDFCDVKGQARVKRGLEVAAAGGHNLLMIGPPGAGKTMLARRLPTIMPELTFQESLETTKIHSVAGTLKNGCGLMSERPFRNPHHTTSDVALIGGGSVPKPGEVTLAHNGVLFLDELPEFRRNALEALRQPMEDQSVTIARALRTINFPSKFMLVASMNPCPCGYATDPKRACHCSSRQIHRYTTKISGPLLDRIDIHLEVPPLPSQTFLKTTPSESSADIRQRVLEARNRQNARFAGTTIFTNAQMGQKELEKFCPLSAVCRTLLEESLDSLNLSARAQAKIIKVARTIADLEGKDALAETHLAEAIRYRSAEIQ